MNVYVVLRSHRRLRFASDELVSVYSDKKSALNFVDKKNAIHESLSPYNYRIKLKKLLP